MIISVSPSLHFCILPPNMPPLVRAAHMCMDVGPYLGAWETYQWPHPEKRTILPSPGNVPCQ